MIRWRRILAELALVAAAIPAQAEGALFRVPTREGVTTTLFWEVAPDECAMHLADYLLDEDFGREPVADLRDLMQ